MFIWGRANAGHADVPNAAACPSEEFARLQTLRDQYQRHQDCGEFGLDERRLCFVRWMVEHGQFHDEV